MIHDKDYIIRIVKEFSEFLAGLLLGKNEGEPSEQEMVFETQMKDVFRMTFEELDAMSVMEISAIVSTKDAAHQLAYVELLGHLFFFKFQQDKSVDRALKAKVFYERWLSESQIFSLPVMARTGELKSYLENTGK